MRRDEEAVDLLVGIVGEREDDPVRPRAGLARLAPRCGARCRRAPGAVEIWMRSPSER